MCGSSADSTSVNTSVSRLVTDGLEAVALRLQPPQDQLERRERLCAVATAIVEQHNLAGADAL